ncbi:MAG: hypothetical protein RMZ41_023730 [Nostoc sp. DedVER02]|uniref:hypothetical protein n=1 Tax=unclassified Nostoc TaxID=2593658 RepID=UPI002AD21A35|nr:MULTISPECIES: hypothetical protein [unclassified Nostoc]MDZ7984591.1 hypothetical protein [Nostoc sp. DedVER02]MDZ8114435.1 hypothetical protein [Nostoc sp. DedVER01b]
MPLRLSVLTKLQSAVNINLCPFNLNLAALLNSDAYGGKLGTCLFWHVKIAIASSLSQHIWIFP